MAARREADTVAPIVKSALVETGDDDDVPADAFDPSLKRNHTFLIADVKDVQPFSTQRRVLSPQPHQLLCEQALVRHRLVVTLAPIPPNQELGTLWIVGPVFVF